MILNILNFVNGFSLRQGFFLSLGLVQELFYRVFRVASAAV